MKTLVIDVPGLHLGYLGCYGNDWVGTPNIDRLACNSIVFERHYLDVEEPFSIDWLKECQGGKAVIEGGAVCSLEAMQRVVDETLRLDWANLSFAYCRFPSLAPPWRIP